MDSADRDDVRAREEQARQAEQRKPDGPHWIVNVVAGLFVSAVLIALMIPVPGGGGAPRSEQEEQLARQQLVDQQIAEVEAALAAEYAAAQ